MSNDHTSARTSALRRATFGGAAIVAAIGLIACGDDGDDAADGDAAASTTEATTTTTAPAPTPPEPGEPNTATVVFDDGEEATVPVICDFDPGLNLAYTVESDDADPNFGLSGFTDMEPQAQWESGDEIWVPDPFLGGELVVDQDAPTAQSPITGTGLFFEVEVNGGEPTATGEQRAGAFTVVCAE